MFAEIQCFALLGMLCLHLTPLLLLAETKSNSCSLVWQGVVKDKVFQRFDLELCRTEAAAKTFLRLKGLEQYWDLAKGVSDPDAGHA